MIQPPDVSEIKNAARSGGLAVARWLVWHPARLIGVAILVGVALVAYIQLRPAPVDTAATSPTSSAPEQTWPATTAHPNNGDDHPPTPTPTDNHGHDESSGEAGDGHDHGHLDNATETKIKNTSERLARRFVTAFLDSKQTPQRKWVKRLQPLTTPELGKSLRTVDPVNVPPGEISAVETTYVSAFRSVVTVSTTVGPMAIEVNWDGTRWLITRYSAPTG